MPDQLTSLLAGKRIHLVGCGKMGSALLDGLLADGLSPEQFSVQEPAPSETLQASGVTLNPASLGGADIIIVAVKPQAAEAVLSPLDVPDGALVISLMAGVPLAVLQTLLGDGAAYVRTMPNTPAAIGRGITGLFADPQVSAAQRDMADALLQAVGETVWLDSEKEIDFVTAVSGSGPAYVFHMVEALAGAGTAIGLDEARATQLALRTLTGAAAMLEEEGADPAQLRRNVTSPGGTTEAALDVLMAENGLIDLMRRAAHKAVDRARDLAQLGDDNSENG